MRDARGELPFWSQYGDYSDTVRAGRILAHGRALRDIVSVLPPLLRATVERVIKPGAGPMQKWRYWLGRELPT